MRADKLKLLMTVIYAFMICFACINLWANLYLLKEGYDFLQKSFTPEGLPFLTRAVMNFRVSWMAFSLCLPLVASAAFFGWPLARAFPAVAGLTLAVIAQTAITIVAMAAPIWNLSF